MKITITLETGNDDLQKPWEVADCLHAQVVIKLERMATLKEGERKILDVNGNTVGVFKIESE